MRRSLGIAALSVAFAFGCADGPALAVEIDLSNLPPWPANRIGQNDFPSRLDKAPVGELVAAADAGDYEASVVLRRRQRAADEAVLAWGRAGAAQGNPRAMVLLADTVAQSDPAEKVRLLKAATALGDGTAMRRLGGLYAEGAGVEKDYVEGIRLWKAAAEAGNRDAMYDLANAYRMAVITPKDTVEADRWEALYRARGGIRIEMYPGLPPEPRDPRLDRERLLVAAESGDIAATRDLGLGYLNSYPSDPAHAFRWLRAAAEKGDAVAMGSLGQLYMSGDGVRLNKATGIDWLTKGAKAGSRTAMYVLHDAYKRGDGVKADPDQSQHWLYQWFWTPDEPKAAR